MGEKVMFIRYDGNKPRIMEDKNKRPLEMYDTPEGFRVYITDDLDMVGALCTKNATKYRLFRSKAFKVKQLQPNSSYRFETLKSWNYKKVTVDTRRLDSNEERIFETKIEWYEHGEAEIAEPCVESIVGGKPKTEPEAYSELRKAKTKISELEALISDLKKKNSDLEKANAAISEENEMIKAAIAASEPKGVESDSPSEGDSDKKSSRGRPPKK